MRVNHYQEIASGSFLQLVYLVQQGNDIGTNRWELLYANIAGFNYEPGYVYSLRIKKETVDNPPADASSINYKLEEVISKEKVAADVTFSIKLKPTLQSDMPTYITGDTNAGFKLLKSIDIQCGNLCDQLAAKLKSSESLTGIFQHADSNTIKLVRLKSGN